MKNIFSHINNFKFNTALICEDGNKVKYSELIKKSKKLSKYFYKKKKLAIIVSENSLEFIISYVSCIRSNLTIMLVNSDISNNELVILLNKYKASLVLSSKEFDLSEKIIFNSYKQDKINIYKIQKENNNIKNKELSLLLPTSGSTGESKFVKLTNLNLITNTRDISVALSIKKKDRTITTLRPNYSYGISVINTHLFIGASIILNKYNLFNKNFWTKVFKYKPNNFNVVPYLVEILKKINFKKLNRIKLKYITQAGGALDDELKLSLVKYTRKNKIKLYFMYGQTEASPRISILPPQYTYKYYKSVGFPIGQNKVFIKKKNSNKLLKQGDGEIVCKGKNIFIGYAKNYISLNKIKKIKILKTGDYGKIDNYGLIYIIGRNKRLSKIFGTRFNLDQLDNFLKKMLNIKAVSSVLDNKLFINIVNEKKIKKYLIISNIQKIINIPTNYINIKFVKNFIRNADGKLLYKKA